MDSKPLQSREAFRLLSRPRAEPHVCLNLAGQAPPGTTRVLQLDCHFAARDGICGRVHFAEAPSAEFCREHESISNMHWEH
eukprot:CAMPEP_0115519138 /NCGR_PEP_ID=MMETSP0271-20121206/78270_1 /TAXON_ID=71861 /ORGANISM="Scrippsiella trochoidea, Strain CCMP3099" /LENGTH=80 /DNA_ID=CAMNT_0002950117 /DNA_START=860 /DNA_END=1099 /DNA_ORIENTATION=-